jgi:hypothetical protein
MPSWSDEQRRRGAETLTSTFVLITASKVAIDER